MEAIGVFRVFYRDYANEVVISSAQPEQLAADRLAALAGHLLVSEDNFLGVVDASDTILQLYPDAGKIVVELVFPDTAGCYRSRMTREDAMELLTRLPAAFDESLLPGGQYIG